jgi:[acyl-carrier-protein] S-malonyltransferase
MKRSFTLLFPGQGSQYLGMGIPSHFEHANEVLGIPLSDIVQKGPVDLLNLTKHTQPAILSYSHALYEKLKSYNLKFERVLGHSLGEYSALVVAGSLSFKDALKAVFLRGSYMQEAVPAGKGKMYALLGADPQEVASLCQKIGGVIPANYNEPNQIVISGMAESAEKIVETFKGRPGFRALELKVSAPFHSPLMKPAAEKLAEAFKGFVFKKNSLPYIANVDAKEYPAGTDPETIKQNLINQIHSSVLWSQSFAQLPDNTVCIEVGPSKVLTGLAKKINPRLETIALDTPDGFALLEKVLQ